jgi:hypothetical protein
MTTPQTSQNEPAPVNGAPPADPENFLQLDEHAQARLVLADLEAAHHLLEAGQLDAYGGEYVAVLRGQVVGHDTDLDRLFETVAREQGIHPNRLSPIFVEDINGPLRIF